MPTDSTMVSCELIRQHLGCFVTDNFGPLAEALRVSSPREAEEIATGHMEACEECRLERERRMLQNLEEYLKLRSLLPYSLARSA